MFWAMIQSADRGTQSWVVCREGDPGAGGQLGIGDVDTSGALREGLQAGHVVAVDGSRVAVVALFEPGCLGAQVLADEVDLGAVVGAVGGHSLDRTGRGGLEVVLGGVEVERHHLRTTLSDDLLAGGGVVGSEHHESGDDEQSGQGDDDQARDQQSPTAARG